MFPSTALASSQVYFPLRSPDDAQQEWRRHPPYLHPVRQPRKCGSSLQPEPTSVMCPNGPVIPQRVPHTGWSGKSGPILGAKAAAYTRTSGKRKCLITHSTAPEPLQELQNELSDMRYVKNSYIKYIQYLHQVVKSIYIRYLKRSSNLLSKGGSLRRRSVEVFLDKIVLWSPPPNPFA